MIKREACLFIVLQEREEGGQPSEISQEQKEIQDEHDFPDDEQLARMVIFFQFGHDLSPNIDVDSICQL